MTEAVQPAKIGIEESRKIVNFVSKIGNVVGEVFEDNKINLDDADQIIPFGSALLELRGVDYSLLGKEAKDYDAAEREALAVAFAEKFDIPQDKTEGLIEKGIALLNRQAGVIIDGLELYKEIRAL